MSKLDHLVPINNICNQKCNFCSAEDRMGLGEPIPLKQIFEDILAKWDYIQISWWEPLLHPKVFEILFFIRKHKNNCFIEFQSNGLLLLKKNNLDNLLKFNINLFNINYPSHLDSINDEIVRVRGTRKIREAWMHAIIAKWWKLRINIIVNSVNYPTLPETIEYIAATFSWLDRIQMSFTKAMWAADKNEEVVPQYEQASPYMIEALRLAKWYDIHVDVDHIPMCFLWDYFTNHVDYNKILRWEHGVFETEKNYVEKCWTCDKQNICSGYRRDYLKIYSI